jgi:hypothetical protein
MGTKWNYQSINVKLCYRSVGDKKLFHVIVPEGDRFGWTDFIKLKNHLRSKFSNMINKELYTAGTPRLLEDGGTSYEKDQPVYEYNCDVKSLIEVIESFAKTSLDLGEYEFSFSTIDYDYVSLMKGVPLDNLPAGETFLGEVYA